MISDAKGSFLLAYQTVRLSFFLDNHVLTQNLNCFLFLRYKYENEPRELNIYVTPKPLLNQSLFHNDYAGRYSSRLGEQINRVKESLLVYRDLLEQSFYQGNITFEEIHQNNVQFLSRCRTFYSRKATFYTESVEYPSRVLAEKIEVLERRWREFDSDFHSMYEKVRYKVDLKIECIEIKPLWRTEESICDK